MKLKSLSRYICLLIFTILFLPLHGEEEIDLWNKKKEKNENSDVSEANTSERNDSNISINSKIFNTNNILDNNITIEALAIKTIEKLCPYGKLVIGCNNIMQLEILLKATNTNINNNILEEAINIGNKYDSILWDTRNWK